jgi:NAD(P)-dependent dehydrogenase (short-subunit alcohol dehydrogenase family)
MGKLDGKIAVITGGTTGIGFSTAQLFLKEGARVIVTGRNAKNVEAAQEALGTNALAIAADASDLSSTGALMKQVSQKFGRIDVLFANAGIAQFAPAEQVDEKFFDRHFDLNVKGLYFTVHKSLALLCDGFRTCPTASSSPATPPSLTRGSRST